MTKNNYKPVCVQRTGRRLGDYIKKVNVRNTENLELPLMGLSIQKCFIPSIANTIGTNMKTYKIIEREQFAYGPVTSRNGDKITIALFDDYDKALISQAYIPFEIKDKEKLLPKYLMMWFSRPEFDRYARFKSHGSARETFDWEEMCDVKLPIPSIEKQREIVADYQAVENKIKTNEAICEKLEETAQTIYRRWFEEFEFPDKEGKSYKSNGGEMVWNEELEKEVPKGWEAIRFTKAVKLTGGGTPKTTKLEYWDGDIPFFTPADISGRYYSVKTIKNITELGLTNSSTKLYPKNTVFITARGTVGAISLSSSTMAMNQSCYAIKDDNPFYTHQLTLSIINELKSQAVGAVFNALVTRDFDQFYVCNPNPDSSLKTSFDEFVSSKYEIILELIKQNQKLYQLQSLLLGRMTREEELEIKKEKYE